MTSPKAPTRRKTTAQGKEPSDAALGPPPPQNPSPEGAGEMPLGWVVLPLSQMGTELFSELDAGEESLRRARRQLGVYRQSLLKQAFEGKLTGERSADGGLPRKWRTMTLKEACENIKVGIVIQPKQYYSIGEGGIKAFRSANVREFRIEDSNWVYFSKSGNDANPRTQLKADDVLIVRSGYPGTSCVVPAAFEGCNAIDILIATPNQQILRSDFLCAFNNSPLGKGLFDKGSRGVAQKHLNVGVYSALTISIPSLPEQREIVRLLDEQFTVIEQNEREIDAALKRSAALRQSILKKAFTGQLVPPACRQAGKTPEEFPQPRPGKWWVYVLKCSDGSFYKGFTENLPERWNRHLSGTGAKWTKQHPPVELLYWEEHWSEASAIERERYLKSGSGREWFQREVVENPHEYEPASALLERIRKERETHSAPKKTAKKSAVGGKSRRG